MRPELCFSLVLVVLAGCASGVRTMPPSAAPSASSATSGALPAASASPSIWPSASPSESPSESPSTFPTPTVTPMPTPSAPAALHGWVERASFPGESLDVLVVGGPGLIAAGSRASTGDADPGDALVRLSADGSTWRTAVVEESSGGSIHAIRQVNGTYVALGTRHMGDLDLRGAVWTSPDAERWTLVTTLLQRFPIDIVERDGRLLAAGTTLWWSDPGGFFAWSPDDLGRWGPAREVDAPDWFPGGFVAEGVITTSGGYLAFGNVAGVIPDLAHQIFVWVSEDGLTWRSAPAQGSLEQASFVAVVERPDGYLAVGWALAADGSGVDAVWRSVDGLTWDRTLDPAGLTGGRLARAALSNDRVLVRGTIDDGGTSRAVSWESLDGVDWTLLPLGADIPDVTGTMPSDPVTLGGERLAVATFHDATSTRAVVLAQGTVSR